MERKTNADMAAMRAAHADEMEALRQKYDSREEKIRLQYDDRINAVSYTHLFKGMEIEYATHVLDEVACI